MGNIPSNDLCPSCMAPLATHRTRHALCWRYREAKKSLKACLEDKQKLERMLQECIGLIEDSHQSDHIDLSAEAKALLLELKDREYPSH